MARAEAQPAVAAGSIVLPLALAQFVASYAGSNMNVAISTIADDIGTTVIGMQTTITLFTLTMASLMIPGSKLTDIWGRKVCFMAGLAIYGAGALLRPSPRACGLMIFGYSLLEGVGSALMIPPIYILITVLFPDTTTRAKYFGMVSGAAGLGAAAGPLIGGLVTSAISWRASFVLQVLVVAAHRRARPPDRRPTAQGAAPRFDLVGAILSAAGLFFVVFGILQSSTYGWFAARTDFTIGGTVVIPKGGISPVWLFVAIGALFLGWFFLHIRSAEKDGQGPAAVTAAVPQPDLEPRAGHPEHPVADHAGVLLRDLGLPAAGPRLQRDPDRPDADPRHDRHPAGLRRPRGGWPGGGRSAS